MFGPELEELATFPLTTPWQGRQTVSPDLSMAVLSLKDRIVAVDRAGRVRWQTEHVRWGLGGGKSGSCWVTANGEFVLATAPAADTVEDEWWVLDAKTGRRCSVTSLDCAANGSVHLPHPDGVHVCLLVGQGSHVAKAYWGDFTHAEPAVWSLPSTDRILMAVRPDGKEFLTTAHSGADIAVHHFDGGEVTARATAAGLFGTGHDIDPTAGYVTADIVIASTRHGQPHALLTADDLHLLAYLDYPDDQAGQSVLANGNGTWLTIDDRTGHLQLWRAPHQ